MEKLKPDATPFYETRMRAEPRRGRGERGFLNFSVSASPDFSFLLRHMDPATLEQLRTSLLLFIVLLLSIALHEYGHAKAADLLGDPLPRAQGRVTLNPVAHWSLWGTLIIPGIMIFLPILTGGALPFMLIGWGKPVIISLPNKKTRVRDDILVTLAGPAMNLLLATLAAVAGGLFLRFAGAGSIPLPHDTLQRIFEFMGMVISLNLVLLAFNLVPLPPLDGSHILRHAVRMKDETYLWLTRNSLWILLVLINVDVAGRSLMMWLATPFRWAFGTPLDALMGLIAGR